MDLDTPSMMCPEAPRWNSFSMSASPGVPHPVHRRNTPGHKELLSNCKNILNATTQNTPPTLGYQPTAPGNDLMMTTQKKGSLEVDGAAVQPPPPPASILPSESQSCEKNSHYRPKM